MASLAPLYQQISEAPAAEIEMIEVSREVEKKEEAPKKDDCCKDWCKSDSESKKWCKGDKRSFGRRLCACCCGFLFFGLMLWMISGIAVASYFGVKAYRCVHPRYQQLTTFTFADDEVKEFDIGVVSGFINVYTCPKAEKITLVAARRAASPDHIDVMPIEKSLTNGIFKLNILAPTFDFQHCQSGSIDLVIPERLAEKLHLSLKAQTIMGKITINAPKYTFDKLSVLSNLGFVNAQSINAKNSVEAEAKVGSLHVRDVTAKAVALRSTVGVVCADRVKADEVEVTVETGRASLGFFTAPTATIQSELGWVSAWGWQVAKTLNARVDYGRLNYAAANNWQGKFHVESPYGYIDASHHKDAHNPVLAQNTPAIVEGKYKIGTSTKDEELTSSLVLKGIYGAVNFFIPSPQYN